jgi:hypothetical protein
VNYCLKELIRVGHVKIENFKKNPNKAVYLYLLTPIGLSQKTFLASDFLKRKMREYKMLKSEIKSIKLKLKG